MRTIVNKSLRKCILFLLCFFIDVGWIWGGFGEGLGRGLESLGASWVAFGASFFGGFIWNGLWEGSWSLRGLILDSKMMFGDQSGAGMFKKWLGTFVSSFDLVFLDVGGWGSKATGQNEVGPADRAQRLNNLEK